MEKELLKTIEHLQGLDTSGFVYFVPETGACLQIGGGNVFHHVVVSKATVFNEPLEYNLHTFGAVFISKEWAISLAIEECQKLLEWRKKWN